jgi:hypothetical protein
MPSDFVQQDESDSVHYEDGVQEHDKSFHQQVLAHEEEFEDWILDVEHDVEHQGECTSDEYDEAAQLLLLLQLVQLVQFVQLVQLKAVHFVVQLHPQDVEESV